MKVIAQMTIGELAAYVCSHLEGQGSAGFHPLSPWWERFRERGKKNALQSDRNCQGNAKEHELRSACIEVPSPLPSPTEGRGG